MLLHITQILAIILVALAMAPALAHAFEFPGKKRLSREAYLAVQAIYYPGFTLLGVGEPAGLIAVIILLVLTPSDSGAFRLTLIALFGLLGMQAVYWALIHPINKYWLQQGNVTPGKLGGVFFSQIPQAEPAAEPQRGEDNWRTLRNRWEYAHIARAVLASLSFVAIVLAASRGPYGFY